MGFFYLDTAAAAVLGERTDDLCPCVYSVRTRTRTHAKTNLKNDPIKERTTGGFVPTHFRATSSRSSRRRLAFLALARRSVGDSVSLFLPTQTPLKKALLNSPLLLLLLLLPIFN